MLKLRHLCGKLKKVIEENLRNFKGILKKFSETLQTYLKKMCYMRAKRKGQEERSRKIW